MCLSTLSSSLDKPIRWVSWRSCAACSTKERSCNVGWSGFGNAEIQGTKVLNNIINGKCNKNRVFSHCTIHSPRELFWTLFGRFRGFVLTNRPGKRVFRGKLTLDTYRCCFGMFQRRSWLNIGRREFRRDKRGSTANIELIKYVLGCTDSFKI